LESMLLGRDSQRRPWTISERVAQLPVITDCYAVFEQTLIRFRRNVFRLNSH
jgi:hypothetical protein